MSDKYTLHRFYKRSTNRKFQNNINNLNRDIDYDKYLSKDLTSISKKTLYRTFCAFIILKSRFDIFKKDSKLDYKDFLEIYLKYNSNDKSGKSQIDISLAKFFSKNDSLKNDFITNLKNLNHVLISFSKLESDLKLKVFDFFEENSKDINNLNLLFDYINHIRPNNLKKYDNSETDILITPSIRLLIQPKAGQSVYDPCFGSGNLLNSIKYLNVNEEDDIKIYGKESSIDAWLKCIAESCLKDRFKMDLNSGPVWIHWTRKNMTLLLWMHHTVLMIS